MFSRIFPDSSYEVCPWRNPRGVPILYTHLKVCWENHLLLTNKKGIRTAKLLLSGCDQLHTFCVRPRDMGHNCRAQSCTEALNHLWLWSLTCSADPVSAVLLALPAHSCSTSVPHDCVPAVPSPSQIWNSYTIKLSLSERRWVPSCTEQGLWACLGIGH